VCVCVCVILELMCLFEIECNLFVWGSVFLILVLFFGGCSGDVCASYSRIDVCILTLNVFFCLGVVHF